MNTKNSSTHLASILTIIAATCLLAAQVAGAESRGKLLHDFEDASAPKTWIVVNDNVMGGVSQGGPSFTQQGTMVFSGTLSLENRGGFSSVRTRTNRMDLSAYDSLVVRVRGDGRSYWLTVNTNARIPAGNYRAVIDTQAGQWQTVRVPFSQFRATSFGRVLPRVIPLDRSKVESVGFLLADKKAGPFRLEVDSIHASVDEPEGPLLASSSGSDSEPLKDIVDTAVGAGSFKTLVAAVKAAGLVDTLKSEGPFTVFAPTDEAFAKLPKGTVESLLKPANRDKLVAILTTHVVPGRLGASRVLSSATLDTVQGASLLVSKGRGGPRVDASRIVKTDIQASNGVIHVIDTVLLPKDIVDTAKTAGNFNTLLAAAKAAGLVDALKGDGPLTVFAPTDKAFADLPEGTVADLLLPANRDRLAAILKYHVVPGKVLLGLPEAKTLQGGQLDIRSTGRFQVDEATVALANVKATNGVVHVIDRVLLPALPEPNPTRKAMGIIELAIERGVPLYNSGKPEACAAIYELTVRSLLDGFSDELSADARDRLRKALRDIRKDHRAQSQAWTLRHALDAAYRSLRHQGN